MRTGAAIALLLLGAWRCLASADAPPTHAIAWWRLDPTRFASSAPSAEVRAQREAMLAMVRSAVAGGVMGDVKALAAVRGALAASEIGARPHTLCVLDFAAHRPPSGAGIDVDRLRMALRIEAPGGHDRFLPTLRTILLPPAGDRAGRSGRQRAFELPGGVRAVAYREDGWEPWREVSWASTEGAFLVGLGDGALEDLSGQRADADPPWLRHRDLVNDSRAEGEVFFEAYLGIARLRDAFPEAFATGRAHRTLLRLGLLHASDLMLHARFVELGDAAPPAIAIDATWTVPGEAEVRRLEISLDDWPEELRMPPPPGSYVIISRVQWERLVALGLDLWLGANVDIDLPAKQRLLQTWRTEHGADLDRFLGALGPFAVISDCPTPLLPIPGAATAFVPLREGADDAAAALRAALSPVQGAIQTDRSGVSSYAIDPVGLFRMPGWVVVDDGPRPAFIAAWSPGAVEGASAWLRSAFTPGTSPKSSPSPTP